MLSIGKLALGQQRYYEQSVAQGQDDYYSGRGEAPGEWTGAGADELGLSGRVSAAQFNALLEGRDPRVAGERLRAGNSEPSIAAFDLTFSAPKSVSVLFAVAPAEISSALVECHEEAVRSALGYLEDEAVFVRRGKGGVRFEHAGGLIAAAYRHRMSRALDPQLHTHVVAANLARGEDGRYTALHHPSLYRAARTAGYLYQSELRALVRDRLGLEWGPVHKGAAELVALPADVLRAFSQRRAQVEQAVAEREAELGRPATRAERERWGAIATRDRKHYGVDTHTWQEEIAARASEHGLDSELVDGILERGGEPLDRHGALVGDGVLEHAGGVVGERELGDVLAGPAGLTARANTFDDGAVLREFAAASAQGSHVATVRLQADRFASRDDVLAAGRGRLTSADLVGREAALIDTAISRVGEGVARLAAGAIERAITSSDRPLTADQAAAVRAVAGSGNGVDVIEALAGTGKTYTAGVLRELYESAGFTVIGVAPTGRAVRELSEQAGIRSRTLDSRVLAINEGYELPPGSIVVFDEAGMASTRMSEQLLANATKVGAKVVAIGDPGQLASVQAGGWLRAVSERIGAIRLTEVMRQRDPTERLALAGLHDGDPSRWLDWATAAGRVEILPESGVLEQAVSEWAAGVAAHGLVQSVMISRDNETRRALNDLARTERRELGALGEELAYGPVTVAVGDRVICRNNERDLDVDNGTRGTVRLVTLEGIVIETDAHSVRELPAGYLAEHVEHAYALTGHGMQGGTVEHAIVVASAQDLTRGWSYTALSRARGETRLLLRDSVSDVAGREEHAPTGRGRTADQSELLRRVARQMLERDDEDLAIDQITEAGRADDPQLTQPAVEPLQKQAPEHAETALERAGRSTLSQMRDQIERLRSQLDSLPTEELEQLDELDTRARELTERRDQLRATLELLPAPQERRVGRNKDPHIVERTRLASALAGTEDQLQRVLAQRATLGEQLGDVAGVGQELDGLAAALRRLERHHTELRNDLAEREVGKRPEWAHEMLGERPERPADAERWDRAARTVARYRIEYEITPSETTLGPEPVGGEQRRAYLQADLARQQLARELGRQPEGIDLGWA